MLKRVVDSKVAVKIQNDFEWCCRPVLLILNIFGIPLWIQEPNLSSLWISYVVGWLLYFGNVLACLLITFLSYKTGNVEVATAAARSRSTAWIWNSGVSHYNTVASLIATHTVLLSITAVRWKDLVRVLSRMERSKQFAQEDFKNFHTIFLVGTVVCAFGCLAVFALSFSTFLLDLQWWQLLIYAFQRLLVVYICLAIVSFSCFGWMASTMLTILAKEIDNDPTTKESPIDMDMIISKWNRHYLLIIDFIHQLNRCFGSLLLVLVAPAFVRVINTSFYLMIEMKGGQWTIQGTISLFILLAHFVSFTVVVNIPHKIRQGAIDLTRKLRRLHFEDFSIQNQVNVLTMEISNSLPKISAAGFFDVDLQLIPTLIGTTLTYLIILFQFQTSEKT